MAEPTVYRLALVGFGAVGQGLAKILRDQGARLAREQGVAPRIVAVAARTWGAYRPEGLDLAALLRAAERRSPADVPHARHWAPLEMIAEAEADVLVEVSPTDLASGEPATSHVRAAFGRGWHVITANKGPVALHMAVLRREAAAAGVFFGYEGTVMSGTPALRLALSDLAGCAIGELRGIVNGTTNYILTQMERGMAYADALAEAQRLGYAEADPRGDVEGHDAAGKAAILANALLGASLRPEDVEREGITGLTREAVAAAQAAGERWKLIARVWRDGDVVRASVYPMRLPASHPLAGVAGATNALTISTDLLGDVTV
ncbi:MAG TPA: homoserine dehydrogenase, partial [Roseiflexaceae bacterium]|nr:homoserine dehydrogenase [Roseiflexaceae bacterium]